MEFSKWRSTMTRDQSGNPPYRPNLRRKRSDGAGKLQALTTSIQSADGVFGSHTSELGVADRGSPIVEGAGERYFDNSLRGGDGIRSRFLLVLGNDAESSTMEAAKRLAGSFADIVELRLAGRQGVTLVRPDGYIAYAAFNRDGIAALGSVRSLLERQTKLGRAAVAHQHHR